MGFSRRQGLPLPTMRRDLQQNELYQGNLRKLDFYHHFLWKIFFLFQFLMHVLGHAIFTNATTSFFSNAVISSTLLTVKNPTLDLQLLSWSCLDNCRYHCMHQNYQLRILNKEDVSTPILLQHLLYLSMDLIIFHKIDSTKEII